LPCTQLGTSVGQKHCGPGVPADLTCASAWYFIRSAALMAVHGHQQGPQKLPMKTGAQSDAFVQLTSKSLMSMVWLAASHPPPPAPLELLEELGLLVELPAVEVDAPPVPPAPSEPPSTTTRPPQAALAQAPVTKRVDRSAAVRFIAGSAGRSSPVTA
jgi:hypothetical protein